MLFACPPLIQMTLRFRSRSMRTNCGPGSLVMRHLTTSCCQAPLEACHCPAASCIACDFSVQMTTWDCPRTSACDRLPRMQRWRMAPVRLDFVENARKVSDETPAALPQEMYACRILRVTCLRCSLQACGRQRSWVATHSSMQTWRPRWRTSKVCVRPPVHIAHK